MNKFSNLSAESREDKLAQIDTTEAYKCDKFCEEYNKWLDDSPRPSILGELHEDDMPKKSV